MAVQQKNAKGDAIGSLDLPIRTMEVLFAPHLPSSVCKYIVDQDGVKGLPSWLVPTLVFVNNFVENSKCLLFSLFD